MSRNPILDYYVMAYTAGALGYPIFHTLVMPSRHSKSLTAFRFAKTPKVLLLPGDTTVQSFRNALNKLQQKMAGDTIDLNLIIVEDATKIRYKVREDFYALLAQFSTGIVTVDQQFMNFTFKSHASVIVNCPPYYFKSLERHLLNAGSGDRFELVSTSLAKGAKERLDDLGMYNMPNNINMAKIPLIKKEYYPDFVIEKRTESNFSGNMLRCKYALRCAGLDENLIEDMHNKEIKKIEWDDYWIDQIVPG